MRHLSMSILNPLMAKILILSNASGGSADLLPALALLQHEVKILPAEASVLVDAPITDCIFIDARRDLPNTKAFTKLITAKVAKHTESSQGNTKHTTEFMRKIGGKSDT